MKTRTATLTVAVILAVSSLYGCRSRMESAGNMVEDKIDSVEDSVEQFVNPDGSSGNNRNNADTSGTSGKITKEEAESAALNHAGLKADEVNITKSQYEIDNGMPHYDIEFRNESTEYDYEISASDGSVISFDRD